VLRDEGIDRSAYGSYTDIQSLILRLLGGRREMLTMEHLWGFLEQQGFLRSPIEILGELELLCLLDKSFDRALCFVAEGYQRERAVALQNSEDDLLFVGGR
jgi:hypothetical protein